MKTIKNDKLDYLLYMVAAECCKTDVEKFDSIDDSKVEFSEDFCKKRDRIIRKYKYRPFLRSVRKVAARAAIVLMAIMSAAFITVMAIEPLREAVFEAVIEWYDDHLTIRYEKTDETANESTDETETSINEAAPPKNIEDVRKPTNLPDGVVEDIVIESKTGVLIDYYLDSECLYTFEQMLLKDRDKYIDSEKAVIDTTDINGNEATIIEYDGKPGGIVVWTDGEYVYQINLHSEKVDLNDLLAIARSVE